MATQRLLTSAHTIVYINGEPYGVATSFEWDGSTPRKQARGVDVLTPIELMPSTVDFKARMSLLRLSGDNGTVGAGMTAGEALLSKEKYFTVVVVDRKRDLQIFRADECSVESQHWSIPERGLVRGTVHFTGLGWNSEHY